MIVAPACFFSPTGIEVTAVGESSSGPGTSEVNTSEASTTGTTGGPSSTGGPEPSSTGGPEPTTGGGEACGNAQIDRGEDCDSGELNNGMNGSLCKADCQLNTCGDGYAASNEGCDDGNVVNGDGCSADCLSEDCGDGKVQPGEDCDDGMNGNPDDTCTDLCKSPVCGDGLLQPSKGETCDNAGDNGNNKPCTEACKTAACGDGLLLDDKEFCDDGNKVDTDDCRNDCTAAKCGDAVVNAGKENCDDGNLDPGDGCSADCKKECGNGLIDPGEQCDDGNAANNDTCDTSCARLAYHVFVTSTQYTADFGGLPGADKSCNTLATTAKLPGAGKFKAWLSTNVEGENPLTRLSKSPKPYILTTNTKVANNWNDLINGDLFTAITVNETKQPATMVNPANCNAADVATARVWTNTTVAGDSGGSTACSNWSVTIPNQDGGIGLLNRKDVLWTDACALTCDKTARFYCVEQPPI